MTWFLLNILLAVIWMLFWGWASIWSLAAGFVLGYLLLGLLSRMTQTRNYASRGLDLLVFGVYFIKIMVIANLQVAWEVLTPGYGMTPRMIRYDIRGLTPVQATTLAGSITLTPGTLTVDISDTGDVLYIHAMYAKDVASAIAGLDELRDNLLRLVFGVPAPTAQVGGTP